jgi:F0F1-type ATP synthase delta subunit
MTEETKAESLTLPPYPQSFFDYTEEQEEIIKYKGDLQNINSRVSHKLFNVWVLWCNLRNNEKLINVINKESDTDSDEFFLKQTIVSFLDFLAKILGNTHIAEEIIKLSAE